jgi:hypothetical protein
MRLQSAAIPEISTPTTVDGFSWSLLYRYILVLLLFIANQSAMASLRPASNTDPIRERMTFRFEEATVSCSAFVFVAKHSRVMRTGGRIGIGIIIVIVLVG